MFAEEKNEHKTSHRIAIYRINKEREREMFKAIKN